MKPVDIPGYNSKYSIFIREGLPVIVKNATIRTTESGEVMHTPSIELKQGLSKRGHMRVRLYVDGKGTTFMVHRLMLLCCNISKLAPDAEVLDHIDGDKTNNHISNLRLVNNRQNQLNRRNHRGGALFGATFSKSRSHLPTPWTSAISVDGRYMNLGHFSTELEAHRAYCKAYTDMGFGDLTPFLPNYQES